MEKQVLVVDRQVIENVGMFQGMETDVGPYIDKIFSPNITHFMSRPEAEEDPSFQQIIPYVLIKHDYSLFSYKRGEGSGESRLLGDRSVGIGGHISPVDVKASPFDTYLAAVGREVNEEVDVLSSFTEDIVAIINDDSNSVGKVHIGIVHIWNVENPNVTSKEDQISEGEFISISKLMTDYYDELETWSQICLGYFGERRNS